MFGNDCRHATQRAAVMETGVNTVTVTLSLTLMTVAIGWLPALIAYDDTQSYYLTYTLTFPVKNKYYSGHNS